MASMSTILKIGGFNFMSKASPQPPSLAVNRKVSRVFFASVSKQSEDHKPDNTNSESDSDVKDATHKTKEKFKGKTKKGMENSEETIQEIKEKAKEETQNASNTAEEAKEITKERAHETKEKTKGKASKAKEKTDDMAGKVVEKAKETVVGAWDMAKDATHKIKETVVGKNKENGDVDDFIEDHVRKPKRDRDG